MNLVRAQDRMIHFADKKRSELSYDIDDWVFVKLRPYQQHSVALKRHQKLRMKYFGPFQVLQKLGSVAYKLQLLATARIHPVFHASILKKCFGDPTRSLGPLPLLTIKESPCLQPEFIVGVRQVIRTPETFTNVGAVGRFTFLQ